MMKNLWKFAFNIQSRLCKYICWKIELIVSSLSCVEVGLASGCHGEAPSTSAVDIVQASRTLSLKYFYLSTVNHEHKP